METTIIMITTNWALTFGKQPVRYFRYILIFFFFSFLMGSFFLIFIFNWRITLIKHGKWSVVISIYEWKTLIGKVKTYLLEQRFRLRIQTWVWPQSPQFWTASYGLRFSSLGCGSWVEQCRLNRVFCIWVDFLCPHLSWSLGLTF